jgi:hypothetical protein
VWQRSRELNGAHGSERASSGGARVLARVEKRRRKDRMWEGLESWRGTGGGVQPTAGHGRGGTGSSSVGAGERRERGGGPIRENGWWAGPGK